MINVLSLFDGISCGQLALNNLGIHINKYYASEINKDSIQITMKHFPNTIQLGNVLDIKTNQLDKIDLLIGGSPCQDLSRASQNGKGLKGEKSRLFYEYIRILKETKPIWFLLENVIISPRMTANLQTKQTSITCLKPTLYLSSTKARRTHNRIEFNHIVFFMIRKSFVILFYGNNTQNHFPTYSTIFCIMFLFVNKCK